MLRPVGGLGRFTIGATDGPIGHVRDVRFRDGRWGVCSLVVEAGRPVLISPRVLGRIDPERGVLHGCLTRTQVANSPHVDTDRSARSGRDLIGQAVQGLDGRVGRVADLLLDDRTWRIHHLVVAIDDGGDERMVSVPVGWVSWVSWEARSVMVALPADGVRRAPDYDDARPLRAEDDEKINAHYGPPPFGSL